MLKVFYISFVTAHASFLIGNKSVPDTGFSIQLGNHAVFKRGGRGYSWRAPEKLPLGDVTSSPVVVRIESIPVEQRIAIIRELQYRRQNRRQVFESAEIFVDQPENQFYVKYLISDLYMTAGTLRELVSFSINRPSSTASATEFSKLYVDFEGFDTPMKFRDWSGAYSKTDPGRRWLVTRPFRVGEKIPDDELVSFAVDYWQMRFLIQGRIHVLRFD